MRDPRALSVIALLAALGCAGPAADRDAAPDGAMDARPDAQGHTPDSGTSDAALPRTDAEMGALLELGSGTGAAADTPDGASVALYAGPQGGFHVYISLRARGLALGPGDEPATVELAAHDAGGAELTHVIFARELAPAPGGWFTLEDLPLVLTVPSAEAVIGTELRVHAAVRDASGVSAACDRRWHVVPAT